MNRRLFRNGGPLNAKYLGNSQYNLSIDLPTDSDGRLARECPANDCSPGYFKVKLGTGLSGQDEAYCPYCRQRAAGNDFATQEQARYAKDLVLREAHKGIRGMMRDALGLGASGRRSLGGGLLSIELRDESRPLPPVRRPFEDEVRRDVICPHCTLDQTVFGLATWCADCGQDIFLTHVIAELEVTRRMVGDVGRRGELLGKRVASKDLENCLEDLVTIFEAALKAMVRRALALRDEASEQIQARLQKIGNAFQSVRRCREQVKDVLGFDLGTDPLWDRLAAAFEKRHPVAHNLGVIDRKYLERVQVAEAEGREVRIDAAEIEALIGDVADAIKIIHGGVITGAQDPGT